VSTDTGGAGRATIWRTVSGSHLVSPLASRKDFATSIANSDLPGKHCPAVAVMTLPPALPGQACLSIVSL
jgi:hypothetical protein